MKNMKDVAINNLLRLGVHPEVIRHFQEDEHNVWCSERQTFSLLGHMVTAGILYDTTQADYTYKKEVDEALEYVRKQGALPYHVVQTNMEFGNTFAVLYISPYEDEDSEINDACFLNQEYGYRVYAYVHNADEKDYSEYGSIAIKEAGGGLIRTS